MADKFRMSSRCPRKLKSFPTKPCALAHNRLKGGKGCEWFIDDEEAKYCFWCYIYLHPGEQHSVTNISKLWDTSVNNVSIAERSAHSKIIRKIKE